MNRSAIAVIAVLLVGCGAPTAAREASGPTATGRHRASDPGAGKKALQVEELLQALRDLTARGDLDAARARAADAIARFPDRVEPLYASGTVDAETCKARYKDGSLSSRPPEAVAHCERCITRMTDVIARGGYRHDHYNRGTCHAYLDREAEAEADFTVGIAAHPDDGDYFASRGQSRVRLGRNDDACADFRAAMKLGVTLPNAFEKLCATKPP